MNINLCGNVPHSNISSNKLTSDEIITSKIKLNNKELTDVKIVEDISTGNNVIATVAYVDSVVSGGGLDNYYTKEETDERFYNKSTIDSNFYTKDYIDENIPSNKELINNYVQKTDNSLLTFSNSSNEISGNITTSSLTINNKEIIDVVKKDNVVEDENNDNKKIPTLLKVQEMVSSSSIDLSNYTDLAVLTNPLNQITATKFIVGPQNAQNEITNTTATTSSSDDKIIATKKYVDDKEVDLSNCVKNNEDTTLTHKFIINNENNEFKASKLTFKNYKEINGTTASSSSTYDDDKILATKKYVDESEVGKLTANGGEIFNDYVNNIASNSNAHAEGSNTTASNVASHAEGYNTIASGNYSHAEGSNNTASGNSSHAEGFNTTSSGISSHTEGSYTLASANNTHASGNHTTANQENMFVVGKYNETENNENKLFVVGNGIENNLSDALVVNSSGNTIIQNNLSTSTLTINSKDIIDVIKVENDNTDQNKKVYSALKVDSLISSAGVDLSNYTDQVNFSNYNNSFTAGEIIINQNKSIIDVAKKNGDETNVSVSAAYTTKDAGK